MNIRKILFTIVSVGIITSVSAQVGGNNTYEFLNLPISARVAALGGNFISVRDNDLNAAIVNPALLTDTVDNNLSLSYINHFSDINYGYVAYARHLKNKGNVSAGIHYLDYGNFNRADELGNIDGTFAAQEMSLNLAYAQSVLDSNLTMGATLKTIYSQLDAYTSFASAVDLGAVYARPNRGFSAAVIIKNIGNQWKPYVQGNKEKLPFEVQIGISKKPKHAPFRISVTYENVEKWDLTYVDPADIVASDNPFAEEKQEPTKLQVFGDKMKGFGDKLMLHMVVGGEFLITKNFNLRAGYNYQRRQELKINEKRGAAGWSFGFGFKVSKFNLSYARAIYHLAGPSNNFSISCDLNSFYSKRS